MNIKKMGSRKKSIYIALLINVLFLILCKSIFFSMYESNDDSTMKMILSGYYGVESSYVFFSNIFLGFGIKFLYSVTNLLDWYTLFQLVVTFISFSTISYLFIHISSSHENRRMGICLSLILLLIFGVDQYLLINFTKLAGLASSAGFLLLINEVKTGKKSFGFIVGSILLITGSFIRIESMLLAGAFFFVIFLIDIIHHKGKREMKKVFIKYCFVFIPSLSIILCCGYFNFSYSKEFGDYSQARSSVVDSNIPEYEAYKKEYDEIGLSSTDINMLKSWTFDDPAVFSTDKLKEIAQVKNKDNTALTYMNNAIEKICSALYNPNSLIAVIMVLLYAWYCSGRTIHILNGVMIFVSYVYLASSNRIIYRVESVIWLAVFSLYAFCFLSKYEKSSWCKKKYCIVMAFCIFLSINMYKPYVKTAKPPRNVSNVMEVLGKDNDKLYLFDTQTLSLTQSYDLYDVYTTKDYEVPNVVSLGTWTTRHPVTKQMLYDYGISNPFVDSVNRNVYFIDNFQMHEKVKFMQEHHNANVYAKKVRYFNGLWGYRLFDHEISIDKDLDTHSEYRFEYEKYHLDETNTYIQGIIPISSDDAMDAEAYIEILDANSNVVNTDMGVFTFDENMDFKGIDFTIANEIFTEGRENYRLIVYLENKSGIFNVGDYQLEKK